MFLGILFIIVLVVARLRADANILPGTTTPLAFNLTKAVFFDPATEARIG